jgi:hypothetical protein
MVGRCGRGASHLPAGGPSEVRPLPRWNQGSHGLLRRTVLWMPEASSKIVTDPQFGLASTWQATCQCDGEGRSVWRNGFS